MPRLREAERGFSIAELVIALSIAGTIGALLFSVWTFTITFTRRGRVEVEAQQFGRIALATMVRELREARAGAETIAVWSTANGDPIDAIGFLSARQEATGRPFSTDSEGDPLWPISVYFVHDRSSGLIRRVANAWEGEWTVPTANQGQVIARGVGAVRFDRKGELVTVTLVFTAGRRQTIMDTAVVPRN